MSAPVAAAQNLGARDAYLALLERYAAGDADGAARGALETDIDALRWEARQAVAGVEPLQAMRRARLSLLLHTEAALRTAEPHQRS